MYRGELKAGLDRRCDTEKLLHIRTKQGVLVVFQSYDKVQNGTNGTNPPPVTLSQTSLIIISFIRLMSLYTHCILCKLDKTVVFSSKATRSIESSVYSLCGLSQVLPEPVLLSLWFLSSHVS